MLFAWTYETTFFERCGFTLIDKTKDLHPRVWSECLRCPLFVGCNENGMVKYLTVYSLHPSTCLHLHLRKCHPISANGLISALTASLSGAFAEGLSCCLAGKKQR
ncbi:MAG: hypothetical protein R2865_17225 [Deinococcales bacterium]